MTKDPHTKVETMPGDVRIITPRHTLREKAGYGGVDATTVKRAQDYTEQQDVDFTPYARDFLTRLEQAIRDARHAEDRGRDTIATLIRPTMDLKASGGMYKYPLVTDLADILLNFLENLSVLNDDAIEVAEVHLKTINAIIASKLTGNGGAEGKKLASELYGACQRYMKKNKGV